jgi:hypothetical protein
MGRLSRSVADVTRAEAAAPRVLVVQLKSGAVLGGYSAVFAQALRLRGAEVGVLICGGGQPICEVGWARRTYPFPCNRCSWFTETWARKQGVPVFRLRDGIPWGRDASGAPLAVPAASPNGVDYDEAIQVSVPRFMMAAEHETLPHSGEVSRDFAVAAYGVEQAVAEVVDRFRPDIVIATNGIITSEYVVKRVADQRGARTVTFTSGMLPETIHFSGGPPAERLETHGAWAEVRDRPLTAEQERVIRGYLDGRSAGRGTYERYYEAPKGEGLRAELDVEDYDQVVTLFSNISWDSGCLHREIGFASMREWVLWCIEAAREHPRTAVVVRIHPDELGWGSPETLENAINEAVAELPPNVRVILPGQSINSYALMDASDVVVTYTSTVGVEAAVRGRPVAVCGDAHYRGKGFTVDVDGPAQLHEILAGTAAMSTEPELALRYAFMFFHRLCIPFPAVRPQNEGIDAAAVDALTSIPTSAAQLAPGADPYLDFVCDRILSGGGFLLPEPLVMPVPRGDDLPRQAGDPARA